MELLKLYLICTYAIIRSLSLTKRQDFLCFVVGLLRTLQQFILMHKEQLSQNRPLTIAWPLNNLQVML